MHCTTWTGSYLLSPHYTCFASGPCLLIGFTQLLSPSRIHECQRQNGTKAESGRTSQISSTCSLAVLQIAPHLDIPMISAFFIYNQKGEVLISRLYRHDLK